MSKGTSDDDEIITMLNNSTRKWQQLLRVKVVSSRLSTRHRWMLKVSKNDLSYLSQSQYISHSFTNPEYLNLESQTVGI